MEDATTPLSPPTNQYRLIEYLTAPTTITVIIASLLLPYGKPLGGQHGRFLVLTSRRATDSGRL